jgi:hypothetical protein
MQVQVRTPLLPEHRAALGEFLRGLGYDPSPPIEERGAPEAGAAFVLWLATAVGAEVAGEVARAVAGWIRENLPKRRRGGTVRVIYGPDNRPLAEVPIDEDDVGD